MMKRNPEVRPIDLHHQERRENLAETDEENQSVGPEHGEITQRQETR